eukprot:CAMPEP_0117015380 /NCGR_PEP_ID=MMETSP0472-20121206/12300_1 /TAXON_ID=693140 ORGANISM="Tiarina fusus, Strain LIS" /NCGR_SAMPLE_ID=MMETSP0472 /ASSEMBLY_ACC=CAM_ASM_000603 /LENGTH=269 /DNA_ID=CAMNT_0004719171 /DNA_START=26 /DNA_END=833 /DNA_ORIENTATION=+
MRWHPMIFDNFEAKRRWKALRRRARKQLEDDNASTEEATEATFTESDFEGREFRGLYTGTLVLEKSESNNRNYRNLSGKGINSLHQFKVIEGRVSLVTGKAYWTEEAEDAYGHEKIRTLVTGTFKRHPDNSKDDAILLDASFLRDNKQSCESLTFTFQLPGSHQPPDPPVSTYVYRKPDPPKGTTSSTGKSTYVSRKSKKTKTASKPKSKSTYTFAIQPTIMVQAVIPEAVVAIIDVATSFSTFTNPTNQLSAKQGLATIENGFIIKRD